MHLLLTLYILSRSCCYYFFYGNYGHKIVMTEVPTIKKLVHWFAEEISGLVSIWLNHRHERLKYLWKTVTSSWKILWGNYETTHLTPRTRMHQIYCFKTISWSILLHFVLYRLLGLCLTYSILSFGKSKSKFSRLNLLVSCWVATRNRQKTNNFSLGF